MSEQAQNQPAFNIQRIYLKDLSLEIPHAPGIFLERDEADIEISIDIDATRLQEEIYEIVITGTVTNKLGDGRVVFLVEAQQAGIFELSHIPEEHVSPILGVTCPTILYPYLRSNISDLITRSGFPPIHMAELNFQMMYEQRIAQEQTPAQVAH